VYVLGGRVAGQTSLQKVTYGMWKNTTLNALPLRIYGRENNPDG